jgi:hypothetical protein
MKHSRAEGENCQRPGGGIRVPLENAGVLKYLTMISVAIRADSYLNNLRVASLRGEVGWLVYASSGRARYLAAFPGRCPLFDTGRYSSEQVSGD